MRLVIFFLHFDELLLVSAQKFICMIEYCYIYKISGKSLYSLGMVWVHILNSSSIGTRSGENAPN